jgi:anti-sigma factor RsiW
MKWFPDSCRRQRQSLSLLAADALSETEKAQVADHLASCADCRKYFEEAKAVAVSLVKLAADGPQLQPGQCAQMRWSNAIRAAGRPGKIRRLTPAKAFGEWWHEVIWPWRRVWAGLAVVWMGILGGNLSLHETSPALAVKSSPQELITAFRDQQKILAELSSDHFASHEADRQKIFSPSPKSEISVKLTT